jgi:hypothetical protein
LDGWNLKRREAETRPLLNTMRRMLEASRESPITPLLLRLILAQNPTPLPRAIWEWAKDNVRYHREDPHVVASLPELINAPVGDCNDYAVAMAALGMAGQYPARFALGYDSQRVPVHVWAQLWTGSQWVDVDPTPGAPPPGEGSPVDVPGASVVGFDVLPVEVFTRAAPEEDPPMSYPVSATMAGFKPVPYVGVAPAVIAAAPALTAAAAPIIQGVLKDMKKDLPAIVAKIKGEIASIAEPCKQGIAGWAKEWDATAGKILADAQRAADPVVKYSLASAVLELAETYPWPNRWAGIAQVDPPGPTAIGLGPRPCPWATAANTRGKYTIPAAAIVAATAKAAGQQADAGIPADTSQIGAPAIPPWAWAAGGVALLLLLRR